MCYDATLGKLLDKGKRLIISTGVCAHLIRDINSPKSHPSHSAGYNSHLQSHMQSLASLCVPMHVRLPDAPFIVCWATQAS